MTTIVTIFLQHGGVSCAARAELSADFLRMDGCRGVLASFVLLIPPPPPPLQLLKALCCSN